MSLLIGKYFYESFKGWILLKSTKIEIFLEKKKSFSFDPKYLQ